MSELDEVIDALLLAAEDALDEGDLERAGEGLRAIQEMVGSRDARVSHLYGLIRWETAGPRHALPALRDAVSLDPDDADARHALARACEESGHLEEAIKHFLVVRRLDEARDAELGVGSEEDLDFIEHVAFEVIERLPAELRDRLRSIPVILEPRPAEAIVEEGFDPRALGLFDGPPIGSDEPSGTLPPRIVLFSTNLLASYPEREELEKQVAITILHEVGHYFGLDEADMERLGLD
ncbi:MAG: metallopeptidase family protein [Myxococcales bacterium]|nr:metallopeptidase family protein [Myxococcales bacterium]